MLPKRIAFGENWLDWQDYMKKWNRYVPLAEIETDRFLLAKHLGFEEGSSIYHNVYVYGRPKVGKNVWVGPFVVLDATGSLVIGDNTSISAGVHIYTHSTAQWTVSGHKKAKQYGTVEIGKNCHIGPHAVIRHGVTIGDNCLIDPNSYVTKDIPSNKRFLTSGVIITWTPED